MLMLLKIFLPRNSSSRESKIEFMQSALHATLTKITVAYRYLTAVNMQSIQALNFRGKRQTNSNLNYSPNSYIYLNPNPNRP